MAQVNGVSTMVDWAAVSPQAQAARDALDDQLVGEITEKYLDALKPATTNERRHRGQSEIDQRKIAKLDKYKDYGIKASLVMLAVSVVIGGVLAVVLGIKGFSGETTISYMRSMTALGGSFAGGLVVCTIGVVITQSKQENLRQKIVERTHYRLGIGRFQDEKVREFVNKVMADHGKRVYPKDLFAIELIAKGAVSEGAVIYSPGQEIFQQDPIEPRYSGKQRMTAESAMQTIQRSAIQQILPLMHSL